MQTDKIKLLHKRPRKSKKKKESQVFLLERLFQLSPPIRAESDSHSLHAEVPHLCPLEIFLAISLRQSAELALDLPG